MLLLLHLNTHSLRQSSPEKLEKYQKKEENCLAQTFKNYFQIQKIRSYLNYKITNEKRYNGLYLPYMYPIFQQQFYNFIKQEILACNQCANNMCRNCVQSYEQKFKISVHNMKCPFCNSQTSNYIDYENEAKSYFDTTTGKNGFLDPLQRKKIDQQMKWNGSKYLDNSGNRNQNNLQTIVQQEGNIQLPTSNNLSNIQNYHEIIVSRRQIQNSNQNNQRNQIEQTNQNLQEQSSIIQMNRNINQLVRQNQRQNDNNRLNNNNQQNQVEDFSDLHYIEQFEARSPQNYVQNV